MAEKDLTLSALPDLYIADHEEAWKIMGLCSSSTHFPDVSFLAPWEAPTAEGLKKVWRWGLNSRSSGPATPLQPAPADITMMTWPPCR